MAENFPPEVFINRTEEQRTLRRYINGATNGNGKLIVVNGEEGSGKSELIKRCKDYAEVSGAKFLSIRFQKHQEYNPYKSFQELISELENSSYKKSTETRKSEGKEGRHKVNIDDDMDQFNSQEFHLLDNDHSLIQQQILSALSKNASEKTLIISMEDSHLASQTVWRFIHYLTEKLKEQKILLIASLRQDGREVSKDKIPAYSDTIQRMNRDGLVKKVTLKKFSNSEVREMLNSMLKKTDFSSNFIPILTEISTGIPALIIKYLRILHEAGIIHRQNEVWFNMPEFDKEEMINLAMETSDVHTIIEKLKVLPNHEQEILQYASLMQSPFNSNLLADTLHKDKIELLKVLQKFGKEKIITSSDGSNFVFKRIEVREAIKESIPSSERSLKHFKIAESIEKSDILDETKKIFLLAKHYPLTDNYAKAFQYLVRAGNLALNNFAFTEAKDLFQRAFLFRENPPKKGTKTRLISLHIKVAWLDRVLGKYDDSIQHCDRALKLCEDNTNYKLVFSALIQKSFTDFRLNNWKKAKKNLDRCLQINKDLSPFEKSMTFYGLGNIYFELGDYTRARGCYEDALIIAKESREKSFIALVLNNLGAVENVLGNSIVAIKLYRQAIPIYEGLNNNFGLARLYNNMGMTYADEHNWKKANDYYGKSLGISDIMGLTPLKSLTFLNRALSLAELGELEEAKEYSFKAERLLNQLKDELGLAEYYKIQALLSSKEYKWQEAEDYFTQAIKRFRQFGNKLGLAETLYERGLMELSRNCPAEASKWLEKASGIFEEIKLYEKSNRIREKIADLQSQGLHVSIN